MRAHAWSFQARFTNVAWDAVFTTTFRRRALFRTGGVPVIRRFWFGGGDPYVGDTREAIRGVGVSDLKQRMDGHCFEYKRPVLDVSVEKPVRAKTARSGRQSP